MERSVSQLERDTGSFIAVSAFDLKVDELELCKRATRQFISLLCDAEANLVLSTPIAAITKVSGWQENVVSNVLELHNLYTSVQTREEQLLARLSQQQSQYRSYLLMVICVGVIINLVITLNVAHTLNSKLIGQLRMLARGALKYLEGEEFKPLVGINAETENLSRSFVAIVRKTEYFRSRYKALFNNTYEMLCRLSMLGNFEAVNQAFERVLGFTERELAGQHFSKVVLHSESFEKQLFTPGEHTLQVSMLNKEGVTLQTEWAVGCSLFDRSSYCVIHDVNERARDEQTLKEREESVARLLNSMLVGMFVLDEFGCIEACNPVAEKMFAAGELVAKPIGEVLHLDEKIKLDKFFENCSKRPVELDIPTADSAFAGVAVSARHFIDGKERKTIVNVLDITERRNHSKLKQQLHSVLSKRLHRPIQEVDHVVGAFLEEFGERLTPLAISRVDIVRQNLARLIGLVSELLELDSRQELERSLRFTNVNSEKVTRAAIDAVADFGRSAGITIELSCESLTFRADERRLEQAIINLLSNAIKFSPSKTKISVTVKRVGRSAEFSVKDQGEGIPPEFLSKLFLPFEQMEHSGGRLIEGTGLGLSLVKSIVERHGGNIRVETSTAEGSNFIFHIPLAGIADD